MKRIVYILFAVVLAAESLCAQQLDSAAKAGLGGRIEEYFGALAGESLEVQKAEADFMIELSADSLIRQFTATKIYEHYVNSPVMGAENVAVHVFDKWFSDGKLKMNSDMDFLNARIFADFNRRSLIGEMAPELEMEMRDNSKVSLFDADDPLGRWRVLYFYDTGCAKCKLESILLRNMLITEDFPVEFYAIYSGDDRDAWDSYVQERFAVDGTSAKVVHLWDPGLDSDFQRKYGVIQTPRMLLVNPQGVIVGRGLDAKALGQMLDRIFDAPELQYGSDESFELFDGIFEGAATAEEVKRVADYMETSTLGQGNTLMFKQLIGDLLYWISNRPGEIFKEGAGYLIDEKILSRPEIWNTADDSLKVVGLAGFMDGLLSKAEPGTHIPGLKVPAERLKSGKSKSGEFRLDKLGGSRNIIIFYTEGCANCEAEKAAARRLASSEKGTLILMVNVDEIMESYPQLASELFEAFDLSTLPFILETDKKGLILRRYITLQ